MPPAWLAYYQQIAIAHVEAGLRTNNLYSPWPEEGNRRLTGALAALHFAPTSTSRGLADVGNIYLIDPLDYLPFVYLMSRAYVILTDSGGIQEEAPSLGKPVLVMRDTTKRPEAVAAGTVKLVGTEVESIVTQLTRLLTDEAVYREMSIAHNPYGDGKACARIREELAGLG